MSFMALVSFGFGLLGPLAIGAACVFELTARKLARQPRHDRERLKRLQDAADIGLVAAWLLLAAAFLCFRYLTPDTAGLAPRFESWMTWMLLVLLVLDIAYLYLRRARPRKPGAKKRFWEI